MATIPVYHVISRAAAFAAARVGVSAAGMETWAHESFDAAVGRRIAHAAPRIVYAYEGSALATLSHARSWGATTVLDVPNAHEYVCSELRAAGSSVGPTAAMTARVREERALADYFLAPSDFVIECLVDHGVPQQKILRVPYGADVERFRPATHQEKGVFRAIFVGTVGDRKGVRYLLEAWRSLALPGAELVLVGAADRSAPTMLREHAGHYRWVGQVPSYEVQRIFSTADVFVFPSLAEGSARVTYEAMALGLPVITTPNSGAVTRPGIDGLLVPPRNVEALREAIATLYSEPELRVNMGRNGRRLIEAGYTWHDYRRRVGKILSAISRHEDPHAALDAAW